MNNLEKIKMMHQVMMYMNDDNAYWEWVCIVPDCPDESDFEDISNDPKEMKEAETLFKALLGEFGVSGLFDTPPEVHKFAEKYQSGIKNYKI